MIVEYQKYGISMEIASVAVTIHGIPLMAFLAIPKNAAGVKEFGVITINTSTKRTMTLASIAQSTIKDCQCPT